MKRAGYTIVGLLMVVLLPTARTMARGGQPRRRPGWALNSDERCIERTTLWGVGMIHDN